MKQEQTFAFSLAHDPRKKELISIPGVGPAISRYLSDIGIRKVSDLRGQSAEQLFDRSNEFAGKIQDRCLL